MNFGLQAELRLIAEPQLPNNASSPNIARIFGTSTSAFELLVLKRKIMGPCWLQIKQPHIEHKGVCLLFPYINDFFIDVPFNLEGVLVQVRGDSH